MASHFIINHCMESPPSYDIIIDRGDTLTVFRIAQFDMQAFLDGTQIDTEYLPDSSTDNNALDKLVSCDRGRVSRFDTGTCAIERWEEPVMVLNVLSQRFSGTIHVFKSEKGYSLRYVRSRAAKLRE